MSSTQPLQMVVQPLRRDFMPSKICHACRRTQAFSTSPSLASTALQRDQKAVFNSPDHINQGESQQGSRSRVATMDIADIPDDNGLIPGTFIKPRGKALPSWFKSPKKRAALEFYLVKNRLRGFASTWSYHRWTQGQPKLKLRWAERRLVARELHKELYKNIAEGDIEKLHEMTATSLLNKLITDISLRPRNSLPPRWSLLSYTGLPVPASLPFPIPALIPFSSIRVVSDRSVALPIGQNSGMRQVVVRISSKQRLEKDGKVKDWEGTEHIVIQKTKHFGKEDDKWKVWGTIPESNWDEIADELAKDDSPGVMDTLRDYLPL